MDDLGLQSIFGIPFVAPNARRGRERERAEEGEEREEPNALPPINFLDGPEAPQTRRRTNRRANNAPVVGIKEREFLDIDTLIPNDLSFSDDSDDETFEQNESECAAGLPFKRNCASAHHVFCFLCAYKDRKGGNAGAGGTKLQVINKMIYDMYINPEEDVRPTMNAVAKAVAEYYENEIRRPLQRRGIPLPIWKRASIVYHISQISDPRALFFGVDGWLSDIHKEVCQLKRMGYERVTTDDDKKTIIINTDAHKLKIEYMKLGLAISSKDPKKMANCRDKSGVGSASGGVSGGGNTYGRGQVQNQSQGQSHGPGPIRVQRPPER